MADNVAACDGRLTTTGVIVDAVDDCVHVLHAEQVPGYVFWDTGTCVALGGNGRDPTASAQIHSDFLDSQSAEDLTLALVFFSYTVIFSLTRERVVNSRYTHTISLSKGVGYSTIS